MKFKIDYFLHNIIPLLSLGLNGAFVSATTTSEMMCNIKEEVSCHAAESSSSAAAQQKVNLYTQPATHHTT